MGFVNVVLMEGQGGGGGGGGFHFFLLGILVIKPLS